MRQCKANIFWIVDWLYEANLSEIAGLEFIFHGYPCLISSSYCHAILNYQLHILMQSQTQKKLFILVQIYRIYSCNISINLYQYKQFFFCVFVIALKYGADF